MSTQPIRCVYAEDAIWFPVVDLIAPHRVEGSRLPSAMCRWLRRNLAPTDVRTLRVPRRGARRGGTTLCVHTSAVRFVGMYEAHLNNGKDFKAKWADLPDTPTFQTPVKKELSWRNMYHWSKTQHRKNSGLRDSDVAVLRRIYWEAEYILGIPNINRVLSLEETLLRLSQIDSSGDSDARANQ